MLRSLLPGLALLLAWTFPAGVQARAEDPESLFERGNAAYSDGRYLEAAQAYREVARYGIVDPRLEYNLGNAEFRLGNLGPAILHLERARRLDPTDADIAANLEFARSFCVDRVERPAAGPLMGWVRGLQDRAGPDLQAWLALALAWAIAALVAWRLGRPRGWRPADGWVVSVLLVTLLAVGLSWYTTHQRLDGIKLGVIVRASVEVLAGPGQNNASLFTVHEGTTLEVRIERVEWLRVSLPNGLSGWVDRAAVELV